MTEKSKVECGYCKEELIIEHSTYDAVGYCPLCGTPLTSDMIEITED
jgi:hypothetical protein